MKYKRLNSCTICNKKITSNNKLIFEKFPVTEIFVNKPLKKRLKKIKK